MTDDELNRKMEFIIEQQAQFTVDIQLLKEAQATTNASIAQLTKDVLMLADTQSQMQEQAEVDRQEMRDGINQMISIAEEMRNLARGLVTAQIGTSQRVSKVEDRLDRLESGSSS
ncbi:MAG: hypothetical protein HY774_14385 [Acidobacteria bacterium]|nr:hypothetical protein [Acidobacteriota bacterium]